MVKYEFRRDEFDRAEEFYGVFKRKTKLPERLGNNADALWDMLTGYIELPCEITLIGFEQPENKRNRYYLNLIIQCFVDARKTYPRQFRIIFK